MLYLGYRSKIASHTHELGLDLFFDPCYQYSCYQLQLQGVYRLINSISKRSLLYSGNIVFNNIPLLIVYAFINRHYILDLVPEVSVVRNLLKQGFDSYATDWGTPSAYDKDLTIDHFVNSYMDKSVDLIRET